MAHIDNRLALRFEIADTRQAIDAITLRHLQCFLAIAEKKSFTKAAIACGLSQPTISGHLSDLEKILGIKLIKRASKASPGILVTPEGLRLIPEVMHIFLLLEKVFERRIQYPDLSAGLAP